MSYDIFVDGSIHNFGSSEREFIVNELEKVKNPMWHYDELDIMIEEDFDMRHIEAVKRGINKAWKERSEESMKDVLPVRNVLVTEVQDEKEVFIVTMKFEVLKKDLPEMIRSVNMINASVSGIYIGGIE